MLTPCRITTRPLASVIHRPEWPSGVVGAASAVPAIRTHDRIRAIPAIRRRTSLDPRGRGLRQGGHVLEAGARQGSDDDRVQRAVARELLLRLTGFVRGHPDGPLGCRLAVEVPAVGRVEAAIEGLVLGEPLLGIGSDGRAYVAEDRWRLAAGVARTALDPPPGLSGELGRHPVEEDAIPLRPAEGRHLRSHGGEDEADAGKGLPESRQLLPHGGQRFLREAGSEAEPEPLAVEAQAVDVRGDLLGRLAVESDHPDPEIAAVRALCVIGQGREPLRARMVVRPHRGVTKLLAAGGQGACDLLTDAGRDAEASAHPALSKRATHSMCGVWGNMSTGFTRRTL